MLDYIISWNNKFVSLVNNSLLINIISDISLLVTRIWIALIYLNSARLKLSDWQITLEIFADQYSIPILGSIIPAFLSVIIEIFFSPLILLGFFSRLFIIPILMMTIFIQLFIFTNVIHIYWILMMFFIISFGSGRISLDYLIAKYMPLKTIN
jgi:putative oxidoreductase